MNRWSDRQRWNKDEWKKEHTTNSNAMITKYIIIRTNRWLWNINIYLFYEPVVNSALYLHLHM